MSKKQHGNKEARKPRRPPSAPVTPRLTPGLPAVPSRGTPGHRPGRVRPAL